MKIKAHYARIDETKRIKISDKCTRLFSGNHIIFHPLFSVALQLEYLTYSGFFFFFFLVKRDINEKAGMF